MSDPNAGIPVTQVPAGAFLRGSDASPDEGPARTVRMSAFQMETFPVTNARFRLFIEAGGYQRPDLWCAAGFAFANRRNLRQPLYFDDPLWNEPEQPVTGVSWFEADAFARFAGRALPTEAQWEYAARGSDARLYPWGAHPPTPDRATFAVGCEPDHLHRRSTRVTETPAGASPFGLRDMAGNVFEWCRDNVSLGYDWDITLSDPIYITDETDDHIARGGSGLHDGDSLRCAARDYYPATLRDNLVGIRLVINTRGRLA